jgi:hypothetical protein
MKSFHRDHIECAATVPSRSGIALLVGILAAAFLAGDAQPGVSGGENAPVAGAQNEQIKPRQHQRTTPSVKHQREAEQRQNSVEEAEEAQDDGPDGVARKAEFDTVTLADGSKVKVKKWGETYWGYDFRPPVNVDDRNSNKDHERRERVHRSNGHHRRDRVHPSHGDERREGVHHTNAGVETIVDYGDPSNHLGAHYLRDICLDVERNQMFWIEMPVIGPSIGSIRRATLDGKEIKTIASHLENPWGLAIDHQRGTIYWSVSPHFPDRRIQRARLDGSEIEDVITGLAGPLGIAIDSDEERIYFTDKPGAGRERIFSAKLDGTDRTLIADHKGGLKLVFDRANRKLYWIPGNDDRVYRSNLNGTNIENPIKLGKGNDLFGTGNADTRAEFWGMDVDFKAGFIYWLDRAAGNIRRANPDGSHVEEIVFGMGLNAGRALALDVVHGLLYWIDAYSSSDGPVGRIRRVRIPDRLKPMRKNSPPIIARIERFREDSGGQIRLIGDGFEGTTDVTFLGVGTGESVSAKFDVASDHKIDVAIPRFRTEAKLAAITVQTPGGVTVTLPKDPLVMNLGSWHTKFDAWASGQRFTIVVQPIARGVGFERAIIYVASGASAHTGPEGMNTLFLKNGATAGVSIMARSTVYFEPFAMVNSRNKVRERTRLIAVPAIRPSFVDALFELPKKAP